MHHHIATHETKRIWWVLSAAAVLYVLLFASGFLSDPLGQAPVLDARENIAWAQIIREGALPQEPIYRALLYPLLLSQFPASSLPAIATLLGLILHLSSAAFVGLIAQRLWSLSAAAWLAALLYAVYPVALYFAVQVLDVTLAITLFLAGVYVLLGVRADTTAPCEPRRAKRGAARSGRAPELRRASQVAPLKIHGLALLAGILGGLAVLSRPNFLPAVLCFPLVLLLIQSRPWKASIVVALGLALMLAAQGWVNLQLSGQFRLLPWQGAYNLYAANRDGANGKYYTQRVAFDNVPAGANTTRMESEQLYREAAGLDAPLEVDAMHAYWRAQLFEGIAADPLIWIGLMGRKVVYVLNNWEQYNNLSYAYHKARWPVLAWNPLGWGVLLLAALTGLIIGYRESSRPALYGIALLGLAYTAGLLLFFISARFRLPIAPLLCIAAGGCAFWPQHIFTFRKQSLLLAAVAGLALLSFGNWFGAKDRATFIQDKILLAKASSEAGDDVQALEKARAVLASDPQRAEARRLEVTSLFNLWLVSGETFYWLDLEESLQTIESGDPAVAFIRGVHLWRDLRPELAIEAWQTAVREYGARGQSSLDALQAIGQVPANDPGRAAAIKQIRSILDLD